MSKTRYTAQVRGKTIHVLDGKGNLAFSSKTNSDKGSRTWTVAGKDALVVPWWEGGTPAAAAVSPDGTKLAVVCDQGHLHLWRLDDRGTHIAEMQVGCSDEDAGLSEVRWTDDSEQVVVGVLVPCPAR